VFISGLPGVMCFLAAGRKSSVRKPIFSSLLICLLNRLFVPVWTHVHWTHTSLLFSYNTVTRFLPCYYHGLPNLSPKSCFYCFVEYST
jgi:hypothetical protein